MSDAGRPRLHLTPSSGWLNDPLALTWRHDADGGRYHLFFQHVPDRAEWAAHCAWGHATSTDLMHWQEQPVALAPAADELGAWSGCVVEGRILYTSVVADDVERGRVRVAWPSGAGRWVPGDLLLEAPADPDVRYFRDPFVVRDEDVWRMLVGAGLADGTGCVLGYVSDDLVTWRADGVVASRHTSATEPLWTGAIWECPQLVRVGGADVLVISTAGPEAAGDVVAGIGHFAEGRFEVASWQRLTTGAPYAASAFTDRDGAPGLVTWLRGVAGDGWSGAVGTPMRLTLSGGRVRMQPPPHWTDCRQDWDPESESWEAEWDGRAELALVQAAGDTAVRLRPVGSGVALHAGEVHLHVVHDGGPVRLLRDGPVLEVLSAGTLAAVPVPPGPLRPEGDGWHAWALRPAGR